MNPNKVDRNRLTRLTDLPNIGPAGAEDLLVLGISDPSQLAGKCPYELHELLCEKTGVRHDPCVIDVLISVVRFVDGEDPQPWWHYTDERKAYLKSQS